ncbi:MAG TPA: MBL fold metallo-hydrolase, partial [Burkholderiales bacterium]|nr:MBL fold metallo-hydrolase [Burkholderiales bacterium]
MSDLLAPGIRVVVRDWLSANHVLITGRHECALIDTGYGARVEHTLALLRAPDALGTRRLDRIVNTHCHSDHMGGNAAIAREYGCPISLPVDAAPLIERWDTRELLLDYAGQEAERFACEATIAAGDVFRLGETEWQALAAPGHDMTALAFYAPEHRILVSGDALWKRGFGLIEPVDRLEERLAAARATLERIAGLDVAVVIPGHGTPFTDVDAALEYALKRLDAFSADPLKAARHCLKSLFVFALLARGAIARKSLPGYFAAVACYREYDAKFFHLGSTALGDMLTVELLRSGAIVER